MHESAKYLIHADVEASGVVERSDVVGAIFGQTEGLLGDELDIRDLQESGRLGRIEVEVDSEGGRSYGSLTIASGLDRVETAILAAALESIERVGPCRADLVVTDLEDARSAKRREIVDRATDLLAEFDEAALTSRDIVEEVREAIRVEDITEFSGLPAGPRVADSDAVVVVEGRSDVLALLRYGVKNAIAVEGTDVPDDVAELTSERTVTAFLDGDRGGDLILRELAQVGDIDYVALAPPDQSVEDLTRTEALTALREKVPFEAVDDTEDAAAAADDGAHPATLADGSDRSLGDEPATDATTRTEDAPAPTPPGEATGDATNEPGPTTGEDGDVVETPEPVADGANAGTVPADASDEGQAGVDRPPAETETVDGAEVATDGAEVATDGAEVATDGAEVATDGAAAATPETEPEAPQTLAGHVQTVVGGGTGLARALDAEWDVVAERPADEAFDVLDSLEEPPAALVVDGQLPQRVLDVAAQRGVEQVVCASDGEYVKQPTDVRVRTAAEL